MDLLPTNQLRLASAIEQLWNWVGEQKHKDRSKVFSVKNSYDHGYIAGNSNAYGNVRLYMRKFFAGLIDFEEIGENTDEQLRGTVREREKSG